MLAGVVEQADTRDLKSARGDSVPVRVRLAAPSEQVRLDLLRFVFYWGRIWIIAFAEAILELNS